MNLRGYIDVYKEYRDVFVLPLFMQKDSFFIQSIDKNDNIRTFNNYNEYEQDNNTIVLEESLTSHKSSKKDIAIYGYKDYKNNVFMGTRFFIVEKFKLEGTNNIDTNQFIEETEKYFYESYENYLKFKKIFLYEITQKIILPEIVLDYLYDDIIKTILRKEKKGYLPLEGLSKIKICFSDKISNKILNFRSNESRNMYTPSIVNEYAEELVACNN